MQIRPDLTTLFIDRSLDVQALIKLLDPKVFATLNINEMEFGHFFWYEERVAIIAKFIASHPKIEKLSIPYAEST